MQTWYQQLHCYCSKLYLTHVTYLKIAANPNRARTHDADADGKISPLSLVTSITRQRKKHPSCCSCFNRS